MTAQSMARLGLTLSIAEAGAHYRIAAALKSRGMTEYASRAAASVVILAARRA